MTMLSSAIGTAGIYETLRSLEEASETSFSFDSLSAVLVASNVKDVEGAIAALVQANLISRSGQDYVVSIFGRRTAILLDAMHGGDLRDTWRRLAQLDPSLRHYELVRNNLADDFLQTFVTRPSFGRIYICSPWLNLDQRRMNIIGNAVLRAEQDGQKPEILVVTRPEQGTVAAAPQGAQPLRQLGASIFVNRNLHTKLYIREPDVRGGYMLAVIGSQNLTRSKYIELGVKIHSDSVIVQQLISYFYDLVSQSDEAA